MMRLLPAIAVLMLSLAVNSSSAHAEEQDRTVAQRFFRAGERAFDAGQYVAAAQAFEEAYETLPLPAIAFSAAQSYRLQFFIDKDPSRLKRSIELYRLYIKEVPTGGRRQDAVTGLADLQPLLDRIEAEQRVQGMGPVESRPHTATETRLMISSQTENAMVAIDQDKPIAMPAVAPVKPGKHKVVFTAEGYFPVDRTVIAVEGELLPVEAILKPKPALLELKTEAGSAIRVDGRAAGQAPFARPIELADGKHLIDIVRNGRNSWSREITVERGQELQLDAKLQATTQRKVSYWVLGSSAATFLASGVFAGMAWQSNSNANDILTRSESEALGPNDLENYNNYRDERNERRNSGYLLAGVGGGLAITGVLLYLLDTPTPNSAPANLAGAKSPRSKPDGMVLLPLFADGVAGFGVTHDF